MPPEKPYQACFSKQVSRTWIYNVCTESTQVLSKSQTFINWAQVNPEIALIEH